MIKNLIFDMGDVLLHYRWKTMLQDFGYSAAEAAEAAELLTRNPIWLMFDYGVMTAQEMIDKAGLIYPDHKEQFACFLNHVDRLWIGRPEIWEKVHALKEQGYGIYILSNYNREMWASHVLPRPFMKDVDGYVVSCECHMIKPEPRIYAHILGKYGLDPAETVFFDDRAVNTEGARKAGISTVTVASREFLAAFLDRLIADGPEKTEFERPETAPEAENV